MTFTWLIAVAIAASAIAGLATPAIANHDPANVGAYDRLSPGNQKIARSLYDSQSRTTLPPNKVALSLDDIAALKKSQGWGRVFKTMKADGLVQDKNLGQAVSRYNHAQHAARTGPKASAKGTALTTGSGKTIVAGGAKTASSTGQGRSDAAAARGRGGEHGATQASISTGGGHGGGFGAVSAQGGASGGHGGGHGGGRGK
jgi:hypothetical protein